MTCATIRVVGERRTSRGKSTPRRQFLTYRLFYFVALVSQLDLREALSSDGIHLLAFRKGITLDPCNVLSDWNETDSHPCNWRGVTCDPKSLRVATLKIDGRWGALSGRSRLSPQDNSTLEKGDVNYSANSFSSSGIWFGKDIQGSVGDGVLCPLSGTISPAVGELLELRTLSLRFNKLKGEIPREISNLRFLEVLDLQSNLLRGELPRGLGRLLNLRALHLDSNALVGQIPIELSSCRELRRLILAGNKLSGTIPSSLGSLPRLSRLDLSLNRLVGSIPRELAGGRCKLRYLDLSRNALNGSIPSELGSCAPLRWLVLNSNRLSGSIPPELGRLSRLMFLQVAANLLSGLIPAQLADCQRLEVLVLSSQPSPRACILTSNDTSGCPSSSSRRVDKNYFEGPLPRGLLSLPNMRVFWAPGVGIRGVLPNEWGSCSSLTSLNLAQNEITGGLPEALSNCRSLVFLDVSSNQLSGSVPGNLAVDCMVVFSVSRNKLSGQLPEVTSSECVKPVGRKGFSSDITNSLLLTNARKPQLVSRLKRNSVRSRTVCQTKLVHDWSFNNFSGLIPLSVLRMSIFESDCTYSLLMAGNQLTGEIPSSLCEVCKKVGGLAADFGDNLLTGFLPSVALENCTCLVEFLAARNRLSGEITEAVGKLKNLVHLDLTENSLEGSLPHTLDKLQSLKVLQLGQNKLRGPLLSALGHVRSLQVLDLSGNNFSGPIPEDITFLPQLRKLYLNNNSLSGVIPLGLFKLSARVDVNLSFNKFSGWIPRSRNVDILCGSGRLTGNPLEQACDKSIDLSRRALLSPGTDPYNNASHAEIPYPSEVPPGLFEVQSRRLSSILIAAITSGCAIALVLLVLGILFQCTRQRSPTSHCPTPGRKEVVTFMTTPYHMTYENVVRATGNFSITNLIGGGGFGATYKAELRPGYLVAVKRLAIGRFQGVQQFDTEIRTLGTIRHPNLVTLIGYHASQDEMFLIYNYFPQGNLDTLIHSEKGDLDWHIRHSIALRIAEALAYLHDECVPRVLHRDIKPSNILLDDSLNAHLSDFGLARLLGTSETHATTDVAGTFGYVAPEYAMTCRVTDKADVYSYGVVLLELLSNKRALGDPSFFEFGDSFNIVSWACLLIRQKRAHEVFTGGLWEQGPEDTLLETLKLAVLCTVDSLSIRPTMKDVVSVLRRLQPLPSST